MRTVNRWSLSGLCAVLMVTQGHASVDSDLNVAEEFSDSETVYETVYEYDNWCSGTITVTYRKVYHSPWVAGETYTSPPKQEYLEYVTYTTRREGDKTVTGKTAILIDGIACEADGRRVVCQLDQGEFPVSIRYGHSTLFKISGDTDEATCTVSVSYE